MFLKVYKETDCKVHCKKTPFTHGPNKALLNHNSIPSRHN